MRLTATHLETLAKVTRTGGERVLGRSARTQTLTSREIIRPAMEFHRLQSRYTPMTLAAAHN